METIVEKKSNAMFREVTKSHSIARDITIKSIDHFNNNFLGQQQSGKKQASAFPSYMNKKDIQMKPTPKLSGNLDPSFMNSGGHSKSNIGF